MSKENVIKFHSCRQSTTLHKWRHNFHLVPSSNPPSELSIKLLYRSYKIETRLASFAFARFFCVLPKKNSPRSHKKGARGHLNMQHASPPQAALHCIIARKQQFSQKIQTRKTGSTRNRIVKITLTCISLRFRFCKMGRASGQGFELAYPSPFFIAARQDSDLQNPGTT